ncbi:unnamed protein product [Rotaria sp. Silwood1]|nr:unnamed protein product [Rotaria sp. Silwood1]
MHIALLVVTYSMVASTIFAQTTDEVAPLRFPQLWNFNQLHSNLKYDSADIPIASFRSELLTSTILLSIDQYSICKRDLEILIDAALRRDLWALKVFDAWGRPFPSGSLTGNTFWIGNYDECVNDLYQENNKSFVRQPIETQYCKSIAISSHSVSSGIYYAANLLDMQRARRNIIVHLTISGAFAVDTFFVLSGFLTAVLFVRNVKKDSLSLRLMVLYYVHRYIRLTPSFILVMLVSIYLTPYFGRGPLYPIQQGFEPQKCRDGNWWTAFLYIGNFLKSDDLCLGITWYLYNDMQFHWVAPLALIPFVKGRKLIAYAITIVFVLVSAGSILGLLLYYPSFVQQNAGLVANTVNYSRVFF